MTKNLRCILFVYFVENPHQKSEMQLEIFYCQTNWLSSSLGKIQAMVVSNSNVNEQRFSCNYIIVPPKIVTI